MTRKEFLTDMIKSNLGYSIIRFDKESNNNIIYEQTGTLIKDCTYSQHYHDCVIELICSIFNKKAESITIKYAEEDVDKYQNKARKFIEKIITDNSDEKTDYNLYDFNNLSLEELNYIYEFIIIKEVFNVKEYGRERADDSFDDSINIIVNKIIRYYACELRKQESHSIISSDYADNHEFHSEIFYKSTELGERFADIKEYLESKKYDFIVLNNHDVTKFQQNTIYRYTGECFFELGKHDEYILYFNYNNQKIQSYTSKSRWLNQSILCNYAYTESSRFFNCYFFYDQGRMFKFLQISEADINAEI